MNTLHCIRHSLLYGMYIREENVKKIKMRNEKKAKRKKQEKICEGSNIKEGL